VNCASPGQAAAPLAYARRQLPSCDWGGPSQVGIDASPLLAGLPCVPCGTFLRGRGAAVSLGRRLLASPSVPPSVNHFPRPRGAVKSCGRSSVRALVRVLLLLLVTS